MLRWCPTGIVKDLQNIDITTTYYRLTSCAPKNTTQKIGSFTINYAPAFASLFQMRANGIVG
jgi:hypothetical protein